MSQENVETVRRDIGWTYCRMTQHRISRPRSIHVRGGTAAMRRLSGLSGLFRSRLAGWHRSRYLNKPEFDALESRLVWIFGSPRSGSTWLLKMLAEARAPGVATIDESWAGELFNRTFAWHKAGGVTISSSADSHA